jgi:hypothetical protein
MGHPVCGLNAKELNGWKGANRSPFEVKKRPSARAIIPAAAGEGAAILRKREEFRPIRACLPLGWRRGGALQRESETDCPPPRPRIRVEVRCLRFAQQLVLAAEDSHATVAKTSDPSRP